MTKTDIKAIDRNGAVHALTSERNYKIDVARQVLSNMKELRSPAFNEQRKFVEDILTDIQIMEDAIVVLKETEL